MGISFVGGGFALSHTTFFFFFGRGGSIWYLSGQGDHSQHHAFKHAVSLESYL